MPKSADNYISIKAINTLQSICNPLIANGIVGFTHDISFPNGELTILTTNKAVFNHWFKNRNPIVCTDENGRTLESGIYLSNILVEKYEYCAQMNPVFHSLNKASQSIHILERDDDCQHFFSFAFNSSGKEFLHWLINNVNKLENFLEHYKISAREIIVEGKRPTNRIVFPFEKNNLKQERLLPSFNSEEIMQKVIHKDSKIPIYLAKQQSICVALLIQGKSAKEIAKIMNLSHRTIQHYSARIRQLLDCSSNKELVLAYGNQIVSEKWCPILKLIE